MADGLTGEKVLRSLAAALLLVLLARPAWAELQVHFIDVGQGDAILLRAPAATVLIDAGWDDGRALSYLRDQKISRLDIIIATHAHADHVGGFTEVLPALEVDAVWYNGQTHTTATFERFIDAVLESGARYHEPVRGETLELGRLVIEVLHPAESAADYEGHLHDYNIVLRARYGDVAFMLTGDAEAPVEAELIETGVDLSALVLKVGHHGSHGSTSPDFVAAVGPEIAVYQAGEDNRYGHPHRESLETLAKAEVTVYGTDTHGAVIVTTDGQGLTVTTDRVPDLPELEVACVDLNTASSDELQQIIHIGPERAEEIAMGRPWSSVRALTRIHGIGQGRLSDIKEQGQACGDP
jgi:competence protein ComEC